MTLPLKTRGLSAALLSALVFVAACSKKEEPPTPTATNAPPGAAPRPAAPAAFATPARLHLNDLKLPAGFAIDVYAPDVPGARSLTRGGPGITYVSTRRDDKVYALVDSDGDHRAERAVVVARGLDTPNGIAFRDGSLYVAEIGRILRYDRIEERLGEPVEPVVVTDALPREKHHGWRYLTFGPDGWLYVPIGAPCNVCKRDEPLFATVSRLRPEGGPLEVYARGVRNSVGLAFHPQTQELWFTDNGRDMLGDDLPDDELNRAPRAGLHFGFPHCHSGDVPDPQLAEGKRCDEFEAPVQKLGAHVASLGLRFYTGKSFPAAYQNAIFLAQHGSWNRSSKSGYRVMVVRFVEGRPAAYEPFVTGFLYPERDEVWGRPVDLELLDDGSLLLSDDLAGAVYRVHYTGEG